MVTKPFNYQSSQRGFALLLTLLVVSVLIAIGLTVLDLSIKQIRLSTNAKESESAFHAANSGVECARYWRRVASSSMETKLGVPISCFGVSAGTVQGTQIASGVSGNGNVYLYEYEFSWGTKPRCTRIQTLIMVADPTGSNLSMNNIQNVIPGYPNSAAKTCIAGERCTVLSTRGYNRTCTTASGYGSVEREVLLQF